MQKGCWFCYNHSSSQGDTCWQVNEVLDFVGDCAAASVKAVSFGGGEPLEYPRWKEVLIKLRGTLFRSLTTNGLLLQDPQVYADLVGAAPDKVHVSIHFPQRLEEVRRVVEQVQQLARAGIKSGINFLVSRSMLQSAIEAAKYVRNAGIENDRIVYLPTRGADTPTALEMAQVAGGTSFQSMSCLTECGPSPRFCSIGWDKSVGAQVRFDDISFAETHYIQPAERVESSTWDGGYLSADWKHYRANPGQEDQYKDIYPQLKEYEVHDGIEYVPPS